MKEQIAANLERAFYQHGFTQPSVPMLQKASDVSLRTLYKYFPSKESMIVGALNYRHLRYLEFIQADCPPPGRDAIAHVFGQLEQWMCTNAKTGCLSSQAMAAFPTSQPIIDAVTSHKRDVLRFFAEASGSEALAKALFVLHEGVSQSWPMIGKQATEAATQTIELLLEHHS